MSEVPVQVTYQLHTGRRRHAIALEDGPRPQPRGQVPRVARLLALAHHFERLLGEGLVRTQGELAALAGVTRSWVTQILNLLLLAPDIQEELLFLPSAEHGPESITERTLRYVLRTPIWREQRARWVEIRDA